MLKLLLLTVIIVGLAIAAIAIRMFVKRDGEFKKSCSGVDPATGRRTGCTCGHGDGGEGCDNKTDS